MGLIVLFVALLFAAFGLYTRHVMASAEMVRLERGSRAYPCVGAVHNPERPQDRPELQIARYYLFSHDRSFGPGLGWHLRFALAVAAIQSATDATRANRLFAAVPLGGWGDFDRVALRHSGRRFCQLDERHRQAIRDVFRSARIEALEAAFGECAPA